MAIAGTTTLSAREIAAQIRSGRLSAVELLRSRYELIARDNPRVNAFVTSRQDAAMAEAANIDTMRRPGANSARSPACR